jgi:hypothetical protein
MELKIFPDNLPYFKDNKWPKIHPLHWKFSSLLPLIIRSHNAWRKQSGWSPLHPNPHIPNLNMCASMRGRLLLTMGEWMSVHPWFLNIRMNEEPLYTLSVILNHFWAVVLKSAYISYIKSCDNNFTSGFHEDVTKCAWVGFWGSNSVVGSGIVCGDMQCVYGIHYTDLCYSSLHLYFIQIHEIEHMQLFTVWWS